MAGICRRVLLLLCGCLTGLMNATCSPALAATGDLIPTQEAVSREEDEAATGSNCSAFGLRLDPKAVSICDQSNRAIAGGRWAEAKQLGEDLTNRYPHHGLGHFLIARVEMKQGKYLSAVRHFEAAVDRSPEVVAAHLNLGLSYAVIQQYKLFEAEMSWVMAKAPKEALPYYYLGRYYSNELEQLDRGLELFREALDRNSNDYKSRYHLGYVYELKGDPARAKSEYKEAAAAAAAQRVPYGWPMQGLARLCWQEQNPGEALLHAQEAVLVDSRLSSSRLLLGKLYVQMGETEKGISELKAAAELDPTDATPHYWISRAYQKMNLPMEAQREQERFVQLKAVYPNE